MNLGLENHTVLELEKTKHSKSPVFIMDYYLFKSYLKFFFFLLMNFTKLLLEVLRFSSAFDYLFKKIFHGDVE